MSFLAKPVPILAGLALRPGGQKASGSRNWPAGSAKAVALIVIMLITVTFYLWSTNRGRATRDVSVL